MSTHKPRRNHRFLIALLHMGISMGALADEKPAYDRIGFSASAGADVETDTMTAFLYARKEGPDPAPLADAVNQAIRAALQRAKQEAAVTATTLDYQTNPTYQEGRVTGWEVRQSIRLESQSPESLARLVGELQSSLALGAVSYGISPERLKQHEDRLIDQALAAFRSRAERVAKGLGRSQYRIVSVQINTAGHPQPRAYPLMAMAKAAAAAAPPSFEPGQNRVEVEVSGTIELQPK